MQVFNSKRKIATFIRGLKAKSLKLGLVPTMGALHAGHLSLISTGLQENDMIVVSIFVNPTQFNNAVDLEKYPRTLKRDIALLKTVSGKKIVVYTPTVEDIYGKNVFSSSFSFDGLEHEMEGKFREGHFNGVATVVKRFFEIVKPHNAYFGEKDFQQLQIIKKLVEKHKLPITIIGCEIYRETSGLAMSSRNNRLEPEYKKEAPFIYKILKTAKTKFGIKSANKVIDWVIKEFEKNKLLKLEYFIIADAKTLKPIDTIDKKSKNQKYRAFIAAYSGEIRLIDNIALN